MYSVRRQFVFEFVVYIVMADDYVDNFVCIVWCGRTTTNSIDTRHMQSVCSERETGRETVYTSEIYRYFHQYATDGVVCAFHLTLSLSLVVSFSLAANTCVGFNFILHSPNVLFIERPHRNIGFGRQQQQQRRIVKA